jgi:hypothetical protein
MVITVAMEDGCLKLSGMPQKAMFLMTYNTPTFQEAEQLFLVIIP